MWGHAGGARAGNVAALGTGAHARASCSPADAATAASSGPRSPSCWGGERGSGILRGWRTTLARPAARAFKAPQHGQHDSERAALGPHLAQRLERHRVPQAVAQVALQLEHGSQALEGAWRGGGRGCNERRAGGGAFTSALQTAPHPQRGRRTCYGAPIAVG